MTETSLPSKPRYEILDGLRGVAALIVLTYHHFDIYGTGNPLTSPINHGYLAVDFFFILSGFVIGYAYDDRWNKMTMWAFFKRRITRLHPLIVLSSIVGAMLFYYGMSEYFPLIKNAHADKVLLLMELGSLMIPVTPRLDIRGWNEQYPLNGNAWSLLFEYCTNILYALFIRHFSKLVLDIFGILTNHDAQAFTVIGGWELSGKHMFIGLTRLLYPFFAGLLLSRMMTDSLAKTSEKLRRQGFAQRGFWICSLLFIIVLLMPRLGGETHYLYNGIYEMIAILFIFPIIVYLGGCCHVTGKDTPHQHQHLRGQHPRGMG